MKWGLVICSLLSLTAASFMAMACAGCSSKDHQEITEKNSAPEQNQKISNESNLIDSLDQEGVIGEVHTPKYKTNVGEAGLEIAEVGVLVSSVRVSYKDDKELAYLKVQGTIENKSHIPLRIGVNTKCIVDSKKRIYGAYDGTSMGLNPGLQDKFEYAFTLPKSLVKDELYFALLDYVDNNDKKKGYQLKWKVKIKEPSNDIPGDGDKTSLFW